MTDTEIKKDCGEMCGDNRFELIEKFKKELFEHTNIETAKDEVAVLDSLLFRCWQMGWLNKLEDYNRQQAEIEELKETKDRLMYNLKAVCKEQDEDNIRADAVKEFAHIFKHKMFCKDYSLFEPCDMADIIDELVKEMVG